jgi:hypothetical protein
MAADTASSRDGVQRVWQKGNIYETDTVFKEDQIAGTMQK